MTTDLHTLSIEEYKETVEFLAKHRVERIFPNPGESHASIVLANLFKYSEDKLTIYDKDLSGDLFNLNKELATGIRESQTKDITIIVEDSNSINEQLLELLTEVKANIQVASDDFVNSVIMHLGKNFYFAVGDANKFRLESSEDERKAICSFNNLRYPKILHNILSESKDTCKPL